MTSFYECMTCLGTGTDGVHPCWSCKGFGMIEDEPEDWDEWDDYEEDGPLDLEDQLENALERAEVQHNESRKDAPSF